MPDSSRLDAAYAAQIRAIRSRLTGFLGKAFKAGEFRDADMERFVEQSVPMVLAARKQASALTDAYLSRLLGVRASGPIDTDLLRGVDASEVYRRPFVTVRTGLANGKPLDLAAEAGMQRLMDIALADVQLSKTHTSQAVYQANGVRRYIRTLTGNKNCGLCYVASTQTYSSADLLPIHPGCDCGTRPVMAGDRAAMDANLQAAHEAAEERFGTSDSGARAPDYRKMLLVREHGELGPVLTVRGQSFTGAADLNVELLSPRAEIEAALRVNPSGDEFNCVNCVTAFELRRRGRNVVARANTDVEVRDLRDVLAMWRGRDGRPASSLSIRSQDMFDAVLDGMPVGMRGFLAVFWKEDGGGHILAVERTRDGYLLCEPQDATFYERRDLFGDIDFSAAVDLIRTDDLEPTAAAFALTEAGR